MVILAAQQSLRSFLVKNKRRISLVEEIVKSRRTLITLVLWQSFWFWTGTDRSSQGAEHDALCDPIHTITGNTCEPTTMYVRAGSVTNLTAYHWN